MPTERGAQAAINWFKLECKALGPAPREHSSSDLKRVAEYLFTVKSAGLSMPQRVALQHRIETAVSCVARANIWAGLNAGRMAAEL
jgi:hypothetical protein